MNEKDNSSIYKTYNTTFNDVSFDDNCISTVGIYVDNSGSYVFDTSEVTNTSFNVGNGLLSSDTFEICDPYSELLELQTQIEQEEELREECPALKEAWEQYQLIKKLVENKECDKYTETRLNTFKKK